MNKVNNPVITKEEQKRAAAFCRANGIKTWLFTSGGGKKFFSYICPHTGLGYEVPLV